MLTRKRPPYRLRPAGLALAVLAALSPPAAIAQTSPDRMTITVTGSRASSRSAAETSVPVDIIDSAMIERTGATETGRLIQMLAPSFNFPQSFVSDGTDLIWPASLRGMGPDQVLVLVNGKRRHQQALVNVQQSIGRGSAGTDINSIPIHAIERIEVLRDGAAPQYGSDAIAGVINIVLKRQDQGGSVVAEYGRTYEDDGKNWRIAANSGFKVGEGFINLTGEYVDRGETNRAGPDSLRVSPPRVTQRIGDADTESGLFWLNGRLPLGRAVDLYFFGGYSKREGNSSGFFRPGGDARTIPQLYPNGFLPTLLTTTEDYSLAVGLRGDLGSRWIWDLSVNHGSNEFVFGSTNSANVSWYYEPRPGGGIHAETPTSANDGTLRFKQWTANFDVKGTADWGLGVEPVALATGLEWRQDGYQIVAGDPVSYTYGRTNNRNIFIPNQAGTTAAAGIQGFPGFSPITEVDDDRDSIGVYLDAEATLAKNFVLGGAIRFEDYSDAGQNTTGKIAARFQATREFALRASASTGFRAPGIQQELFSQVSTTLGAQGVLTDVVTARQGSALAQAFGIQPLKEEESRSAAFGLVYSTRGMNFTADFYQIKVKDRIVFSSEIGPDGPAGCTDPAVCPVRVILDSLNLGAATFFTNAVDTKTEGVDLVAQFPFDLAGGSKLLLDATYSYNKTKITQIRSQSSVIPIDVLFDQTQRTLIEEALPQHRGSIGLTWTQGPWRVGLNNTYYGEVSGQGFTGVKQTWGDKWLTDVIVSYQVMKNLELSVGGNNVFDVYPDKWSDEAGFPLNALGFTYGWETLPFGLNGGKYYVRARYTF